MDLPEVSFIDADVNEGGARAALAAVLGDLGIEAPFVIASSHGISLATDIEGPRAPDAPGQGADQAWASHLGALAREHGADAIVAIGGGRRLDVAKLAAARAGLVVIAVPTQLSHDGICSPVAVVPNEEGKAESIGAVAPRSVVIPLPTIAGAPAEAAAAGLGDLIANPLALRDWALAAEHGLETIDQRAWDFSVESYEAIEPYLDAHPSELARDGAALKALAEALVLSGTSMICSGSSRPASGGEHEISHAIDELHGGAAMHGAQVAFGCVITSALYEEDVAALRKRLEVLGLPSHPQELGLSEEQFVEVLVAAPDTRPGRFTILEHSELDPARARALIRKIWPD